MHPLQIFVLAIGLGAFALAFSVQFRLRHHVSPDRVRELIDRPSELYPNSIPPEAVLDESGRRLMTIMKRAGAVFAASIIGLMVLSQMGI